jgi:DNA-binding NarL/FixJ family response regulator
MAAVLEDARRATVDRSVVIIGERSIQNWLVADLIDERLRCPCQVRPLHRFNAVSVPSGAIALFDVEGMSIQDVEGRARAVLASGPYRGIALMNADEGSIGQLAYSPGVRGIFPRNTPREQLLKGLQAMLSGEYWIPRRVLAAHFERTRPRSVPLVPPVELTRKEAEILELVAGGHRNNAIARRLGVSLHTVKSHLYNLFRKIGAKNRVQAVRWGMEHLRRFPRGAE